MISVIKSSIWKKFLYEILSLKFEKKRKVVDTYVNEDHWLDVVLFVCSETRSQCEALRSDAGKESIEQLRTVHKEHEAAMADMKTKIRVWDKGNTSNSIKS